MTKEHRGGKRGKITTGKYQGGRTRHIENKREGKTRGVLYRTRLERSARGIKGRWGQNKKKKTKNPIDKNAGRIRAKGRSGDEGQTNSPIIKSTLWLRANKYEAEKLLLKRKTLSLDRLTEGKKSGPSDKVGGPTGDKPS